jgi:hypothetical protein
VFHFSAWQVLFLTALVLGYHRQQLARYVPRLSPYVVLSVSGVCVAGAIAVYVSDLLPLLTDNARLVHWFFSKADLGPGRLLVFAGFLSFGLTLLTVAWVPLSRLLNWLLLPLGQHALSAYTLHLAVVACLTQARPWMAATGLADAAQNTLLQLLGVLSIWAMIKLQPVVVQWLGQHWRRRRATLPGAEPAIGPIAPEREPVAA